MVEKAAAEPPTLRLQRTPSVLSRQPLGGLILVVAALVTGVIGGCASHGPVNEDLAYPKPDKSKCVTRTDPVPVDKPLPDLRTARGKGYFAILSAVIRKDGSIGAVKIEKTNDIDFARKLMNAVRMWTLQPGNCDGVAEEREMLVSLDCRGRS